MGANETPQSGFQLIGRSEVYVARYDNATGVLGPELYLGNVKKASLNIEVDEAELFSSSDAAGGRIASAILRTKPVFKAEGTDYRREVLEILSLGDGSALANTVGAVTNEAIPTTKVKKGFWFPLTRRNVSAVVLTGTGGTPTYSGTTDYKVDPIVGRIKILDTSSIADATALEVDYTAGADTSKTVRGVTLGKIEAMIRLVPDPTTGPKYEAEVWRVIITPDGELGFIADSEFNSWSMSAKVLSDAAVHPTEPYYRLIQR